MYGAWSNLAMLALESQRVVLLRVAKISMGGPAALIEMRRMTIEKIAAAAQAGTGIVSGQSHNRIVNGYRRRVRANIRRLSK